MQAKVICVDLRFRSLTLDDLPAIRELSDSMDSRNSPPIGETAERRIRDPLCELYGAFTEQGELVGVGALRTLTKDYAWIEAVRVHGKHQRIGIGTSVFNHGEELARKRNCKIVAYQTVTENTGSCRIGEKLGFTRSHEMTAFYKFNALQRVRSYFSRRKKPIQTENNRKLAPIPAKEAFSSMRRIPDAPTDEICIGWDYRPLVAEIFENDPDMNFFIYEDTSALEVRDRDPKTGETRSAKAIIYGNEKNALLLLNEMRARNKNASWFFCLVPKALEPTMNRTDFKYAKVWTGNKNTVVLFKKHL